MKIVYHCYGGAHASPTAAAIHLGIISRDHRPKWSDFKKIPFFDKTTPAEHGKLVFIGKDSDQNEVYILGRRNAAKLVIRIIKEFVALNGGDPAGYIFVDCVQLFNPFMVTGGYSSRAMGWVGFGRPIVTFGTLLSFPILVAKVTRTIRYIKGC